MTFGIIGKALGSIADLVSDSKHKGYFIHENCPVIASGVAHKHLLHTSDRDTESIASVVNMIVDLIVLSASANQESFVALSETTQEIEKRLGKPFKADKDSSLQAKTRRLLKRTKLFKKKHVREDTNRLLKAIRDVSQQVKDLQKPVNTSEIPSGNNSTNSLILAKINDIKRSLDTSKDNENGEAIIQILDRINDMSREQSSIPKDIKKVLEIANLYKDRDLQKLLNKSLDNQDNKIRKELQDVLDKVKELVDELKFDPDKPKPSEIRTEENSKLIIELSGQVKDLLATTNESVSKVNDTLNKTKEILKRTESTLNRLAS